MAGQWLTQDRVDGVHVVPLEDIVEHTPSTDCVCNPTLKAVCGPTQHIHAKDGTCRLYHYQRTMLVHEAMDGRE